VYGAHSAISKRAPSIWRVAAVVARENGGLCCRRRHVTLRMTCEMLKGRLSEALSAGCDGPHWVGFGHTTEAIKNRLLLRSPLAHSQGQQQHPLEAHLAILGGIPFSLCMRPAAVSSSAQQRAGTPKRERNIGVC